MPFTQAIKPWTVAVWSGSNGSALAAESPKASIAAVMKLYIAILSLPMSPGQRILVTASVLLSEAEVPRRSRTTAEQRPADRGWEYIVEIKMQLAKEADAGAAGAVDREHRFSPDLEVSAHPDHARIDRSDGDRAVAKIVGHRRRELRLNNQKQVIDEIRQLVIVNLRFEVRHAVLDRSAIDQDLRDESAGIDIE
jgi:hypothetical protein